LRKNSHKKFLPTTRSSKTDAARLFGSPDAVRLTLAGLVPAVLVAQMALPGTGGVPFSATGRGIITEIEDLARWGDGVTG